MSFDITCGFRRIALITAYIFYATFLFQPYVWADNFTDKVKQGTDLGNSLLESYKPGNTKGNSNASTLTPQYNEAQTQKNTYTNYYGDPASMSGSIDTDARDYVLESEESRAKVDLSSDPTFGYKCLEKDTTGKCLTWSMSTDVVKNTYPDCETIITAIYDDPQTTKTCSSLVANYNKSCKSDNYPQLTQETIYTPCNSVTIDVKPGQIYGRCRDVYNWYKVYVGKDKDQDDCRCSHHGSWGCFANSQYLDASTPPSGASYFSRQYSLYDCDEVEDDWDNGKYYLYDWYWKYDHSRIERVFIIEDTNCLDFDQVIEEGSCVVEDMIQCDPTGNYCIQSVDNFQYTGQVPEKDAYWKVPAETGTDTCYVLGCTYDSAWVGMDLMIWLDSCPTMNETCIEGTCIATNLATEVPAYAQYMGTSRILSGDTDDCEMENGGVYGLLGYQNFKHYKNSFFCMIIPGELENYDVCLNYENITVSDSFGGPYIVTTTAQHMYWSVPYTLYGRDDAVVTPYYVQHAAVIGGNPAKDYRNVWHMYTKLNCTKEANDCQALIDEGCYYDSSQCDNKYCINRTYTYKCGGTGKIKGYEKTYVCAGDVRCMGTECKDVINVDSAAFGDAVTATEILNNMRVDTSQGNNVFPGKEYVCQKSPKNCCDDNVGGVSITDYISAASATYKVGMAATEQFAPSAYESIQTAMSYLPGGGVTYTVNATGDVVEVTMGSIVQEAVTKIAFEALSSIGVETTTAAVGAVIGMIATVLWVIAILYAIYTILSFLYKIMFQCNEEDMETSVKLSLKLCHKVGTKSDNVLGLPLKDVSVYCCFNSMLARLIHEQGRPQIGRGWGTVDNPDCGGFSLGDISNLDFSVMDLSEYMQYVQTEVGLTEEEQAATLDNAMQTAQEMMNK